MSKKKTYLLWVEWNKWQSSTLCRWRKEGNSCQGNKHNLNKCSDRQLWQTVRPTDQTNGRQADRVRGEVILCTTILTSHFIPPPKRKKKKRTRLDQFMFIFFIDKVWLLGRNQACVNKPFCLHSHIIQTNHIVLCTYEHM